MLCHSSATLTAFGADAGRRFSYSPGGLSAPKTCVLEQLDDLEQSGLGPILIRESPMVREMQTIVCYETAANRYATGTISALLIARRAELNPSTALQDLGVSECLSTNQ